MKIAISSDGNLLDSAIDQRFGRCKYFIIVDTENIDDFTAIENQGAIQGHGAAIKAAQQIGELEVKVVITGALGPNATQVLGSLEIESYHASGKVKDAIDDLMNKKLQKITEIVEAHTGLTKPQDELIFFPLLNNEGKNSEISEHFGHAPFFGLYNLSTKELNITENNLDHTDPTKSPIDQIQDACNPTIIFAKGIGGRAVRIIQEKGLGLKTGDYKTVGEAIANLENLEDQTKDCGHKH